MPKKIKKILIIILFIGCLITLAISSFNIIKWKIDANKTNSILEDIQSTTEINEIEDNDNTEIIEQEEIAEDNPYWDYIKLNLIDVNFNDLKETNNEVKGWIQVSGTNINYPFVQSNDNSYYLTHSFDKSKNSAGWLFLDYRNNLDTNDKNIIIYGHGRIDKTMFGTLKNILSNGWLTNEDNFVVKISTENENTLWQVFSVYKIPTTSDYLQINFSSNEEFLEFTNKLIDRSYYDFKTTLNDSDQILTLSTCYDNSNRVVLHAKLIKKETK